MDSQFKENLEKYAELTIKVGLNLQPGQKLLLHHLRNGGVPIETAPLVRELVKYAYKAGSPLVDVQWRDDQLTFAKYEFAPRDSFNEFSGWKAQGLLDVIEDGGTILTISAIDPDLLNGQDPELVDQQQRAFLNAWSPVSSHIGKNSMNWCLISIPVEGWARKVFPDLPENEQMPALWDALFRICRVDQDDPIGAWQTHLADLRRRANYLNEKSFNKLHFKGPGTDLWLTLPEGHVWRSAGFESRSGIPFTANIPTEEVFTLPDRSMTEGVVSSVRPLVYSGNVIDKFSLTFKDGQVVDFQAEQGQDYMENLLSVDEGSRMLGEVALVPDSSPISQSGLLFYNTLLDENASCHIAIGSAYLFSLDGGDKMSGEEFSARGGNSSLVHADFMVGSNQLDVDGVFVNGDKEAVLNKGEWVF
jgi:aminopeptidase